ncbi:MAG: hypothetical protein OEQ53_13315 [Saprospiraceae bacterium]|nr:hypothetical protein [Saprospiraceae bacterium]
MNLQHLSSAFAVLFILLLISGLPSCQYEEILPPDNEIPIDTTAPPISFSDEIIPIFTATCSISSCHSLGGVAPDLSPSSAYTELTTKGFLDLNDPAQSELYQWLIGNRRFPMPLDGPDQELNRLVLTWITQGALDN